MYDFYNADKIPVIMLRGYLGEQMVTSIKMTNLAGWLSSKTEHGSMQRRNTSLIEEARCPWQH